MSVAAIAPATAAVGGIGGAVALGLFVVACQLDERAAVRRSLRHLDQYEVEAVRDRELLDPFRQRALFPLLRAVTSVGRRITPAGYVIKVREKLTMAGEPTQAALDRFLAIRVVTVVAAPVAMFLTAKYVPMGGLVRLAVVGVVGLALTKGPDSSLDRRVEARQSALRKKLPDVLDLLTISVEAGLGFEQAVDRTVASVPGPLSDEFARMLGETRAGASRSVAMRALELRCGIPEIRSFVMAIIQADTFGISIGGVLRSQADEMRIRRRQIAEEKAQKAPVKMLIPMVFCVFPSLFVVVLGPAMINIIEGL